MKKKSKWMIQLKHLRSTIIIAIVRYHKSLDLVFKQITMGNITFKDSITSVTFTGLTIT